MTPEYTERIGLHAAQTNLTKTELAALKAYAEKNGHPSVADAIRTVLCRELWATGHLESTGPARPSKPRSR